MLLFAVRTLPFLLLVLTCASCYLAQNTCVRNAEELEISVTVRSTSDITFGMCGL